MISVADCASSYALEFNNGKIMLGDADSFLTIGWRELREKLGPALPELFQAAHLICFANWSGLPRSTELLEGIITDIGPTLAGGRRKIFFDLADPSAKSDAQFQELFSALERMQPFSTGWWDSIPKSAFWSSTGFMAGRKQIFPRKCCVLCCGTSPLKRLWSMTPAVPMWVWLARSR